MNSDAFKTPDKSNAPFDVRWADWCKQLQAIAQNGLTFAADPFDIERYKAVRNIAAEMISSASGLEAGAILEVLEKEVNYMTPKVDVRGVVFREDKLLFVRETSDGCWTLPGGWADVCLTPAENVEREIFEESGFVARASKILAVFDRSKHPHAPAFSFHVYKFFVQCTIIGGKEALSLETDAVDFFGENEIPELSVTRVTPEQVHRMFEHHRNPQLPADFDITSS
jgi:ADP-ribose pyrophosphatase YjhB (NUDIX family)